MKKLGFTLIELLAVIVILAVIALIAVPIILGIIDDSQKSAFKATSYGVAQAAKNNFVENMYAGKEIIDILFTYTNGVESSEPSGYILNYEGDKPISGQVSLTSMGKVAIALYNGLWCASKGYDDAEVVMEQKPANECMLIIAPTDYDNVKNVNRPKLATGLTPIKWNGTTWINTTPDDTDWYDYTNKKWANAKSADGSYWVWIPRYAYKITSGYHSNTTGAIDIKFLKNITNDTKDGTIIVDSLTGGQTSASVYVKHPAFKFGTIELTGIWVAKFEASAPTTSSCYTSPGGSNCNVTSLAPRILPNMISWRTINISNAFTTILQMQANSSYGWNNNDVDTHMIKNTEWGAVAYLSKSIYGKTTEVWINPVSTYKTGCAGTSVSASQTTTCNEYNTANGMNASTTGNITGIYDMSGGTYDFVAAYVNSGHANLTSYGNSLYTAATKYKNVYPMGVTDAQGNNYNASIAIYGDAIWETSNLGSYSNSWFSDDSAMVATTTPFFIRGDQYNSGSSGGVFAFFASAGYHVSNFTLRPVVLVGENL